MIRILAISLSLLCCAPSWGETLVIPVQDILMEIPNFGNAPQFNLNGGLFGGSPVGDAGQQGRKTAKQRQQELIDLLYAMYPEALSISIWRGNVIIRLP